MSRARLRLLKGCVESSFPSSFHLLAFDSGRRTSFFSPFNVSASHIAGEERIKELVAKARSLLSRWLQKRERLPLSMLSLTHCSPARRLFQVEKQAKEIASAQQEKARADAKG